MSGVTSSTLPVGEYPTILSVLAMPSVYPHLRATPNSEDRDMRPTLPLLLDAYFDANAHDADGVAACFAADAVVHDERRDQVGCEAIRSWLPRRAAAIGTRLRCSLCEADSGIGRS